MFWFKKSKSIAEKRPEVEAEYTRRPKPTKSQILAGIQKIFVPQKINGLPSGEVMATQDYAEGFGNYNGLTGNSAIPDSLMMWFGEQTFIGFQLCMVMSQHWLINAACEIPINDALRKGHEITDISGEDVETDTLNKLKAFNKKISINAKLKNFGKFARVFGYRIALFCVDSDDPDYYEHPFNPDGITKGSYKGIAMPDPYYVAPQLLKFDPASPDFYEPEFWLIQGKKYHRSHLVIFRHSEVAQLLKPVYLYGGISLCQQIFEKVYQAESASNEANRLLMTKRLLVRKGDVMSAMTDQLGFEEKMNFFRETRDNFGEQIIDETEEITQLDTALAEVAEIITQRYEQVAAVARMPTNKLMQTQLQGFAASGEAEEAIYNGMLETLQEDCFTEFLERHYTCAIRSLGIAPFEFEILWPPIDTITEKEQAEINQLKASTDATHVNNVGSLTGEDARTRLTTDKNSGYHGIKESIPVDYTNDNDPSDIATQDKDGVNNENWITLKNGEHVLLDDNGKIIQGMGGKYNGLSVSEIKNKSESQKSEKPQNEEIQHHKGAKGIFTDKHLSENQKNSIAAYVGDDYRGINRTLRQDNHQAFAPQAEKIAGHIFNIKKSFDSLPPTTEDAIVFRKTGKTAIDAMMKAAGEVKLKKGAILVDYGVMSTSYDEKAFPGAIGFEIQIPKGAKAIDLSETINREEKEIILPPGTKLKVIEAKKDHKSYNMYLKCEVVI